MSSIDICQSSYKLSLAAVVVAMAMTAFQVLIGIGYLT